MRIIEIPYIIEFFARRYFRSPIGNKAEGIIRTRLCCNRFAEDLRGTSRRCDFVDSDWDIVGLLAERAGNHDHQHDMAFCTPESGTIAIESLSLGRATFGALERTNFAGSNMPPAGNHDVFENPARLWMI